MGEYLVYLKLTVKREYDGKEIELDLGTLYRHFPRLQSLESVVIQMIGSNNLNIVKVESNLNIQEYAMDKYNTINDLVIDNYYNVEVLRNTLLEYSSDTHSSLIVDACRIDTFLKRIYKSEKKDESQFEEFEKTSIIKLDKSKKEFVSKLINMFYSTTINFKDFTVIRHLVTKIRENNYDILKSIINEDKWFDAVYNLASESGSFTNFIRSMIDTEDEVISEKFKETLKLINDENYNGPIDKLKEEMADLLFDFSGGTLVKEKKTSVVFHHIVALFNNFVFSSGVSALDLFDLDKIVNILSEYNVLYEEELTIGYSTDKLKYIVFRTY